MPYTPPSQLSPAASKPSSPSVSRSHSYIKGQFLTPELPASSGRPNLPRSHGSSSYLTKHRRSPSLNDAKHEVVHNGEAYGENGTFDPHGSLRKSPPPVTNSLIPAGMTISPPDSSHNSSDDEEHPEIRGRSRDFELGDNLKELQAAIRSIEQRKSGSPTRSNEQKPTEVTVEQVDGAASHPPTNVSRPPLSQEARKISHSRSSTDSNIVFEPPKLPNPPVTFEQDSDSSDCDIPNRNRPAMVRKKSGELVRPALRPSSRRRPSSMPGTPTYSKAVHFDSHLEHVRHFLQVDRPLAVSAGSSPVETYESENEFPFGSDESSTRSRSPAHEWEMRLANFPAESDWRKSQPVFVERVFLSSDNKNLIGTVAVQNMAFQKTVVARFTLDYWKTTSEVVADYNNDVRRKHSDNLDRFNFSIRLADQAHLENKTLFFCIKYTTNGQDFWDNNGSFNYQVDFAKKARVQQSKNGMPGLGARPLSALPRSRPSPPTSNGRPKSMPTSFDDFSTGFDNFGSFGQSAGSLMGEPRLKLRSPRSKVELLPETPQRRHKAGGGQAFGNRYDFNSSLSAAKSNAYAALGEHSGLSPRADTKQSSRKVPAPIVTNGVTPAPLKLEAASTILNNVTSSSVPGLTTTLNSKPAALMSEKPPLTSQSYQELVDKYCFFGTPKQNQPLTKTALSMVDGAADYMSASDLSTGDSPHSTASSGSSTPTPPRSLSPTPTSQAQKLYGSYIARSSSPMANGSSYFSPRARSPVSFGYPYHSPSQLMSESPTPTAIRG
ncbi:hypothetical protein LTR84_009526 [Exophiala bonariae]|uniref:CBM21 domain-containing protein n=1 Tax=Exophiala bonariae TaxID=1690606 RepID=A0AAV9MXX6_9EURO|nr:hypothetical protein LTR84_009526 [Exophiala bonariae]